jgi:hypothetical protein
MYGGAAQADDRRPRWIPGVGRIVDPTSAAVRDAMHLDRPNLRRRALSWLGHDGLSALRHPSRIRGLAFEAAYAVASVVYLVIAAVLIVVLYRAVLEGWVADAVGTGAARVVGWIFAVTIVGFMTAGVIGDIHAAMRTTQSQR